MTVRFCRHLKNVSVGESSTACQPWMVLCEDCSATAVEAMQRRNVEIRRGRPVTMPGGVVRYVPRSGKSGAAIDYARMHRLSEDIGFNLDKLWDELKAKEPKAMTDYERLLSKETVRRGRQLADALGGPMADRLRLLLADWERLRELESIAGRAVARLTEERDAARAEVERLRAELADAKTDGHTATLSVGAELARLRERDARVLHELLLAHGFLVQGSKFNALARVEKTLALLKETP